MREVEKVEVGVEVLLVVGLVVGLVIWQPAKVPSSKDKTMSEIARSEEAHSPETGEIIPSYCVDSSPAVPRLYSCSA